MAAFICRRILLLVPILLGILFLTFFFLQVIPGSPAERLLGERGATADELARLRARLGLDDPLLVQFGRYLRNLSSGEFGRIYGSNEDVGAELLRRLPNTLRLAFAAMLVASIVGIGSGVLAALYRGTWIDGASRVLAVFGMSTPIFWFGILLILVVAYHLAWLPAGGDGTWAHLLLPALTLGLRPAAFIQRLTRSSLLEVLNKDFILTARAKGLPERLVLIRHALRNALVPVVTVIGMDLGSFLSGSVITETIFQYPGLGQYILFGIRNRQYEVVLATVLVTATVFVLANLVVDLTYAFLDPRIRDRMTTARREA